jgi:hypothetical protein
VARRGKSVRKQDIGGAIRCLSLVLFASLLSLGAFGKPNASGISDAEAKRFLSVVQSHVAKDNARALSQVIEFPLSVNTGKTRRKLASAGEFTSGYAKIVTPTVREKILAQQPAKLFHRADGVMIGDGEVWFRSICDDETCQTRRTRIVTFNVPVEELVKP